MRPPLRTLTPLLAAAGAVLAGCADDLGGIELSWAFVDSDLDNIFPRGDEQDVCRLDGILDEQSRQYNLNVRLTVLGPCVDGEPIEDCAELTDETFPCDRFRGYLPEVPTSDEAYLMKVDAIVDPLGGAPFLASPDCIAVPGPRARTVRPGHVTDLAVYQLVVDAERFSSTGNTEDQLDINACRE